MVEDVAREAACQEREHIGRAGGMARVDEEKNKGDENVVRVDEESHKGNGNVVREVAGREEDAGRDIEDIDGRGIAVGGNRNHEWRDGVKGDEDHDMGIVGFDGDGNGNGEHQYLGAGEVGGYQKQ